MLILEKVLDQYSWTTWRAVDQNQDCWTAVMTVVQLTTLIHKMLVFNVNHVSIIYITIVHSTVV